MLDNPRPTPHARSCTVALKAMLLYLLESEENLDLSASETDRPVSCTIRGLNTAPLKVLGSWEDDTVLHSSHILSVYPLVITLFSFTN